ncbi:MAG: TlpA family protein disulfide reductase [Lachnospiraceae bacterium]|nr:TlpA family protein disulfide reductase [Lachnospiraceae bacterium]
MNQIRKMMQLRIFLLFVLAVSLTVGCGASASPQSQSAEETVAASDDNGESASAGTEEAVSSEETDAVQEEGGAAQDDPQKTTPIIDFTLLDQYGTEHTLSEYKGKVVFLNFWATWCPPCRSEMPAIQKLYEEYSADADSEVVILGIAAPGLGSETDEEGIASFLQDNGYTYPVVMDPTAEVFYSYGITAYPTTFMIDKDSNVYGYVTGAISEDIMRSIIAETLEGRS